MKKFIIANWKMNPENMVKAKEIFNSVKKGIKNTKNIDIIVCPPFLYLFEFLASERKNQMKKVKIGAQNCFWEEKGAFTGEISATMLKNLGIEYVILGHSERRKYFQETDEMINKKVKAVLKLKLKPIFCIGENEKERRLGKTFEILKDQLKKGLKEIKNKELKTGNLILAYEPVWAIGTGNACLPEMAKEVLIFLKKNIKNVLLLYGGSVNSDNAKDYILAGFDGLLVGGASLKSEEFLKIIENVQYLKS